MHKHSISFRNAGRGILTATVTQLNIRLHLLFAIITFALAIYFRVTPIEAAALTLAIMGVFVAELINTSIEFLSDAVDKDHNILIGNAKDISAGAVLTAAILSLLVAIAIFLPKISGLYNL